MPQNPDKEKWNEFDWELELRKDDARVNTYANDLPKFIDLPDEDGVIMKRMQKCPELAPAGGDWSKLGPVPYDSGEDDPDDEDEEIPPEKEVDWKTAPGGAVYSESARMARDWAAYYACSRTPELLIPSMKVLCLYGKLMARSGDIIDMSLDEEAPPQSRPLKIALCKRLLADINLLLGHFMKIHGDFPEHGAKCQEHEAVLGHLHDNLLDVMGELRQG